jgi:predicted Rossmann fold flavoprotein
MIDNRGIIVIGAGAGGLMAAGRAAEKGAGVLLLEKTDGPGHKILISGKTRCNLTNACDLEDFISAYGLNGRFLYGAFHRFFRDELLELMLRYGVETKTERGGRIFPVSDDAQEVVRALVKYGSDHGVELKTNLKVTGILTVKNSADALPIVCGVKTEKKEYPAGAVILAAGGASFPATGSSGDGYRLAAALGHTIVKLRPGLVPLVVEETELASSMQGVSLRNVRLTAYKGRTENVELEASSPVIQSLMGEMLFTHFGLGGPITLQMSLEVVKALESGPVSVAIDLKPALDLKQLQRRLQRDFDTFSKRSLHHILKELLPQKMIEPVIKLSGLPGDKPGHQINSAERDHLAYLLKNLRFNIKSSLPLSAAMVTSGGVDLHEIDPRTMASRLVRGLFFCGEVMDIDADTGGYNLQAAFSTGYVAGESAAGFVRKA